MEKSRLGSNSDVTTTKPAPLDFHMQSRAFKLSKSDLMKDISSREKMIGKKITRREIGFIYFCINILRCLTVCIEKKTKENNRNKLKITCNYISCNQY